MVQLRAQGMATPYTVTSDDALWLARAVEAEGPVQAQVAATLINGFAFVRSRGYAQPLATFIRAYAQPVNPRWFPTGDLYLAKIAKLSSVLDQANELTLALRRQNVHSTRTSFSAGTANACAAALNGRGAIPPNATDYGAATLDATGKGYTPLTPATPGQNRLWARGGAESWAGYVIDGVANTWPWLVAAAAVGFVVWKGWV